MPVHNGIEYINESVGSVLAQTYPNWELIIGVNGHSKDSHVYKTACSFKDHRIRVFDMYNVKGKANSLNMMLKEAKYDWIAILDVDDIWYNSKLDVQLPYMEQYDVVGTHCLYFGEKQGHPYIPCGDLKSFDFTILNPIINSSCLVRKSLCFWKDIDGVEDYDLWLRLKSKGCRFYNVKDPYLLHRIHRDSAFNAQGNNLKALDLLQSISKVCHQN